MAASEKKAPKVRRGALALLTVKEVMTARQEKDHHDGGGLFLRIRGNLASWVFRFTSPNGKRREMGLGRLRRANVAVAGDSLTEARGLAGKARALLANGEDPIDTRDAVLAAKRSAVDTAKAAKRAEVLTLARAARAYHERVIEPSRTEKHSAQWIASLENNLGDELWHVPIASIEAGPLLDRLLELQARIPETAGRIRQRLEATFEDALLRKQITTNPAALLRRKLREGESKRRVEHHRSLPFSKIPDFWKSLAKQPGVAARALQFVLLTAGRTSEILEAQWSEIDTDARTWIIRGERMKGGEEHVVDLTKAMLAIIDGQDKAPVKDTVYVFPSPAMNLKPMSNMAMLVLLKRMKLEGETTVHGLRASFSTWANESGKYRSDVIEAALAHRESDRIRAAYSRTKFLSERRELLRDWSAFVTGTNEKESTAARPATDEITSLGRDA